MRDIRSCNLFVDASLLALLLTVAAGPCKAVAQESEARSGANSRTVDYVLSVLPNNTEVVFFLHGDYTYTAPARRALKEGAISVADEIAEIRSMTNNSLTLMQRMQLSNTEATSEACDWNKTRAGFGKLLFSVRAHRKLQTTNEIGKGTTSEYVEIVGFDRPVDAAVAGAFADQSRRDDIRLLNVAGRTVWACKVQALGAYPDRVYVAMLHPHIVLSARNMEYLLDVLATIEKPGGGLTNKWPRWSQAHNVDCCALRLLHDGPASDRYGIKAVDSKASGIEVYLPSSASACMYAYVRSKSSESGRALHQCVNSLGDDAHFKIDKQSEDGVIGSFQIKRNTGNDPGVSGMDAALYMEALVGVFSLL